MLRALHGWSHSSFQSPAHLVSSQRLLKLPSVVLRSPTGRVEVGLSYLWLKIIAPGYAPLVPFQGTFSVYTELLKTPQFADSRSHELGRLGLSIFGGGTSRPIKRLPRIGITRCGLYRSWETTC